MPKHVLDRGSITSRVIRVLLGALIRAIPFSTLCRVPAVVLLVLVSPLKVLVQIPALLPRGRALLPPSRIMDLWRMWEVLL